MPSCEGSLRIVRALSAPCCGQGGSYWRGHPAPLRVNFRGARLLRAYWPATREWAQGPVHLSSEELRQIFMGLSSDEVRRQLGV